MDKLDRKIELIIKQFEQSKQHTQSKLSVAESTILSWTELLKENEDHLQSLREIISKQEWEVNQLKIANDGRNLVDLRK